MPPRPQRSFQQYQSAPASSASSSAPAVNAFPVYRPPPPSSAASAAASSSASRRSPSPDPDRLAHFTVTAYEADLVYGQPELARTLEQRRDGAPGSKGRLVKHASAGLRDGDGGNNDDGEGVWIDRSVRSDWPLSHGPLYLQTHRPDALRQEGTPGMSR